MNSVVPQSIDVGPHELKITWHDGHLSAYNIPYLRSQCPCAGCVHEITGEKILNDGEIAADLFCTKAEPVGHYALAFHFSDGHATGIYAYEALRRFCPCNLCRS